MKKTTLLVASIILLGFVWQLIRFWPDGKLHITLCDVGQGDGAYIRFPNQQDLLIDGGPDRRILDCLSEAMPFYDRGIDAVIMTHPQSDHMNGLTYILERYKVGMLISPPVGNPTESYKRLLALIEQKSIPVKNLYTGNMLRFGEGEVDILWPEKEWVLEKVQSAKCKIQSGFCMAFVSDGQDVSYSGATTILHGGVVLGAATKEDLNHFSIIARLRYHAFDALFTGDSDRIVERRMLDSHILVGDVANPIEVLKVPHHGSRTGMLEEFIDQLHAQLAIISVGAKNRYGHPTKEALTLLHQKGIRVFRTDQDGTVEVVSDGKTWEVKSKSPK